MPLYRVEVMERDHHGYPYRWAVYRADKPPVHSAVMDRDPAVRGEPPARNDAVLVSVILERTGEVLAMETANMADSLQMAFDLLEQFEPA
jgi:hypothetical protein